MLFILLWNYFSFKNPERVMKYLLTICVAIISFSSAAQAKNHIDLKKYLDRGNTLSFKRG